MSGYFSTLYLTGSELQAEHQLSAEEMRSLPATALKHDQMFVKGIRGGTVALSIKFIQHQQVLQYLGQNSGSVTATARPLLRPAARRCCALNAMSCRRPPTGVKPLAVYRCDDVPGSMLV